MTVPEENRPKTDTTDETIAEPGKPTIAEAGKTMGEGEESGHERPAASGRNMQEALEEAGVKPEDYEE